MGKWIIEWSEKNYLSDLLFFVEKFECVEKKGLSC
jgi:hypothetical protein